MTEVTASAKGATFIGEVRATASTVLLDGHVSYRNHTYRLAYMHYTRGDAFGEWDVTPYKANGNDVERIPFVHSGALNATAWQIPAYVGHAPKTFRGPVAAAIVAALNAYCENVDVFNAHRLECIKRDWDAACDRVHDAQTALKAREVAAEAVREGLFAARAAVNLGVLAPALGSSYAADGWTVKPPSR